MPIKKFRNRVLTQAKLIHKATFWVSVTMFVVFALSALYEFRQESKEQENKFNHDVVSLLNRLAVNTKKPIWELDSEQIINVFKSEMLGRIVAGLHINLGDYESKSVSLYKDVDGNIVTDMDKMQPITQRFKVPINVETQLPLIIEVSVTDREYREHLDQWLLNLLMRSVILWGLVVWVLAVVIKRYIEAPLRRIELFFNYLDSRFRAGELSYITMKGSMTADFRNIVMGINQVLHTIMHPIRDAMALAKSISENDYSYKIDTKYDGDLKVFKDLLNDASRAIAESAWTDPMTGAFNRRYLDKVLENLERSKAEHPVTVIFIDVNGLKRINDVFGHPSGDEMIRKVVHVLKRACRGSDQVFRVGGDELIVVCPETNFEQVAILMDRVELFLKNSPLKCQEPASGETIEEQIHISFGLACSDQTPWSDLVEESDKAMIQNKEEWYKSTGVKKWRGAS